MRPEISLEAMERYLAGKATPDELASLGIGRDRVDLMEALRGAVRGEELPEPDVSSWLSNLHREASFARVDKGVKGRGILRRWVGYSAIACLIVFGIGIQYRHDFPSWINSSGSQAAHKTVITGTGERASLHLADGSSVTLAPRSILRYSSNFGSENREIFLEGEALFTVVNQTRTPLTVHTGNTTTRVLGTTFSVRNYPTDKGVKVAVAQGKVSLNNLILSTGDVGSVGRGSRKAVLTEAATTSLLSWADGKLVFDKISLREVLPELERWYGIRVTVTDANLLETPLILTLNSETATDALQLIAGVTNARLTINGTNAILSTK